MDSFGGEGGGIGDWGLPLAAFAAGVIAPERTSTALRNWSAIQEGQLRQREAGENRTFREKQFAAQQGEHAENRAFRERQFTAMEAERADVGKTRGQQRETAAAQLAQIRAKQQAGQLMPGLQFSRDITVGQPEIPAQRAAPDFPTQEGAGSFETSSRVPGTEVRGQVPMTIEEMRKQITSMPNVSPDVQSEMFEGLRGFNVPLTAPKEPENIARERSALSTTQFFEKTVGPELAQRIGNLVRSGGAEASQFMSLIPKAVENKVQIIDDINTGKKTILFIHPQTMQVISLPTDIPTSGAVSPDTARWLAFRSQGVSIPGMPPEITAMPPDVASEVLKKLGVAQGAVNPIDEEIARRLRGSGKDAPKFGPPSPSTPGLGYDFDPATNSFVPKKK